MKKVLSFLAAALMCLAVNAQFSENFNSLADGAVPEGWVTYGDNQTNHYSGYSQSWQAYQQMMLCMTWTNSTAPCDRWLVTPQVSVPSTNPMLIFDIIGVNYGPESPYAESLKIMVSTTDQQKASFSVLEDLGNLPAGDNSFAVNLSAYAGQNVYLAFYCYTSDGMYIFLDNVEVSAVPDYGIQFVSASAPAYTAMGGNASVAVTVKNMGFDTLNYFNLVYTVNGGTPQTITVNNLNVPMLGTYTHTFTYTQATAGAVNMTISVGDPDGETDPDLSDNDGSVAMTFYDPANVTERTTVLEHFTTARCPNCPSAHQRLEAAVQGREDRVVWIAHHSGYYTDNMTISESEDAMKYFNAGGSTYAPACMLDRTQWNMAFSTDGNGSYSPGPVFFPSSDVATGITTALNVPSFVTVNITDLTYDQQSRQLSVTVSGQFVSDMAFDSPRVHLFLMEDSIMASQSGASGTYQHNHVLRACLSGLDGVSEGFTTTNAGDTYSKTFTYTLPTALRANKCWLGAFVSNHGNDVNHCQVANGAKTGRLMNGPDPTTTGITAVEASISVKTYPNPATEMAFVSAESTIRSYQVVNAMGQVVMSQENVNADVLELNVANMAQGVYYISVITDKGTATERLTVVK